MKERSLKGFNKDDDDFIWIRNYVAHARMKVGYKIQSLLHFETTPFQEISVVETKDSEGCSCLDGTPQISEYDGYIYNEMISHIPIVTHPSPKKIAMIGGGDCGPAREAMKYQEITQIDVVEIDERVTELCQKWMTPAHLYIHDPRFHLIHQDGLDWIQKQKGIYDVLINFDRPDPVGPGSKLFTKDFYQYVFDALTENGLAVFQSGSPYYNKSTLKGTVKNLQEHFPIIEYLFKSPFPSTLVEFGVLRLLGKKWDPLKADLNRLQDQVTQYVNSEVYLASFSLPNFVKKLIDDAKNS